jgi:hypothetical protein
MVIKRPLPDPAYRGCQAGVLSLQELGLHRECWQPLGVDTTQFGAALLRLALRPAVPLSCDMGRHGLNWC